MLSQGHRLFGQRVDSVDPIVKTLSSEGFSNRLIQKRLLVKGHKVSLGSIIIIINSVGEIRQDGKFKGVVNRTGQVQPARTPALIKRVDLLTSKENPPSQNQMAQVLKTSPTTILRIIRENLVKVKRFKAKVHRLSPSHIKNRKRASRIVYEKVKGQSIWLLLTKPTSAGL